MTHPTTFPPPPPTTTRPTTLPIVWPTGEQHDDLADHGYLPETAQDHHGIRPSIAAFAIATYTLPGATVLDPDCGAGTVLVEAVRASRHAIGLATTRRWWATARTNLSLLQRRRDPSITTAPVNGTVLEAPADPGLVRAATGTVGLILTAWRHPTPADSPSDHLAELLSLYGPLLAPGGRVVVIARPHRRDGYLTDAPGQILAAARTARLIPIGRCVAMTTDPTNPHTPTTAQRRALARHERTTGHPLALTAHHDAFVFRAPRAAVRAATPPPRIHSPAVTGRGERALVTGRSLDPRAA